MRAKISLIFLFLFLLSPMGASAAYNSQEFITYDGFDIITKSFKAVALIGSDAGYKKLYVSLILMTIALFGSYSHIAAPLGGKIDFLEWVKTFWWAIFFFYVLVFPTGTITVYDKVKNRSEIISDVPLGIVMVAGLTNKIEVGLREMAETAVNPIITAEFMGNGVGYDMFSGLYNFSSNMKWGEEYDRLNLDYYIADCFKHAVVIGDIVPDDVRSNNDFITILEDASYPLIYTVQYSSGNTGGVTTTCKAAYNSNIKAKFNNAYWAERLKSFCFHSGFDPNNAQEFTACRDIIEQNLNNIVGIPGVSAETLIMQQVIAKRINDSVMSGDYADAVTMTGARDTGTSMVGAGIMANQFIPIFRNVTIAITIITSPIIFLFFVAFGMPAFKYWISGFIWIAIWGVMDVILGAFSQDYAYKVYSMIRSDQLGLSSLFMFDQDSTKNLAVLGYMRTIGAMVSMGMVQGILGVANYSLSQVAQGFQGQAEGAGKSAGHTALTTEGQGSKIKEVESSMSTMSNAARFDINERVKSMANLGAQTYGNGIGLEDQGTGFQTGFTQSQGNVGTQKGIESAAAPYGGVKNLAENTAIKNTTGGGEALAEFQKQTGITDEKKAAVGQGKIGGTLQGATDATVGDQERARTLAGVETQNRIGSASADAQIGKKYGMTPEEVSELRGLKERTATPEMIKRHAERNNLSEKDSASIIGMSQGAIAEADLAKNTTNAKAWGNLKDGEDVGDGLARQTEAERNGLLTPRMAESANKALGVKDGKGPVKSGMKAEGWGVNPETGDLMLNGATFQDKNGSVKVADGMVTKEGTYTAKQALERANEMKKEGHGDSAEGLRHMVSKKDGGTAEPGTGITGNEAIQFREAVSMDGKSATFHAKHGTETEWKNLETRTSGSRKEEMNIDNKIKERRHEDTATNFSYQKFTTPTGMKEGYLAYDPLTKGPVMVSGNERYGVDKHIVTMDEKSGGVMLQDVTTDPQTQKVVSGSQSSILVTKEAMKAEDGQTYNGTMFNDTKTGNKLFVDGHKGDMWAKVDNQGHGNWTVYRGYQKQGEFLPKVAGAIFGETGASMMSDFLKGSGEIAGLRGVKAGKSVDRSGQDEDLIKGGKVEPK